MTTASGLIGLVAPTPAGALIVATKAKRGVIVAAFAALALDARAIYMPPPR